MKSTFVYLLFLSTLIIAGCGEPPEENALATDGATADDFARYEAELAAVSGGESYDDAEDNDDAEVEE